MYLNPVWILLALIVLSLFSLVLIRASPPQANAYEKEELVIPPTLQTLREFEAVRHWVPLSETIVIGGTVYNCEPYLDQVLLNIQRIASLFSHCIVVIAIDEGTDGSMERLQHWKTVLPQVVILPDRRQSPYRTTNLVHARNRILDYIRRLAKTISLTYFIMMDCDDVCVTPINLPLLQHVLTRASEWESVTFPGANSYYDTWALSCGPFRLSYRHMIHLQATPKPHERALTRLKNYILRELDRQEWIPCQSSFGGFAVYKVHPFLECTYDNSFMRNLRFWTPRQIEEAEVACGSRVRYPTTDEEDEDCEHRFFHLTAVLRHRARMFIVPFALFAHTDPQPQPEPQPEPQPVPPEVNPPPP